MGMFLTGWGHAPCRCPEAQGDLVRQVGEIKPFEIENSSSTGMASGRASFSARIVEARTPDFRSY